jgi:methionyl-tRNA formyltransferase
MPERPTSSDSANPPSSNRLRLVFMGTPPFAAVCLQALLDDGRDVAAVVSQPDRPAGRGRRMHRSAVAELADSHDIEVLQPDRAGDPEFVERLEAIAPDLAVVVAYGRILPNRVLDLPRLGCINAHASLLPLLRGAAPIQHAILQGHERTGVTIMQISQRMDAGDMLRTGELEITDQDDTASLAAKLAELSARLLQQTLDDVGAGRLSPVSQDESLATYAAPITAEHARINWSDSAETCERRVRAVRPRPGAFTFDGATRLKVLQSRVCVDAPSEASVPSDSGTAFAIDGDALLVSCGQGVLAIDTLQPEGRRPMSGADYQRGSGRELPRELDSRTDGAPDR